MKGRTPSACGPSTPPATSLAARRTNTTLNQAAAVGATAIRLTSTAGRAVGDEVLLEPGTANEESVRIATIPTPAPASPAPNVTLTSALTKAHAAPAAVAQAFAQFRSVAVNIDSRMPTATMPASVVNNRIGHGAANITADAHRPDAGLVAVRPSARPTSTASGSTRCRSTRPSSRWASTPGS